MKYSQKHGLLLSLLLALTATSVATPASACGGFFCSQTQPVNQAAERIVFAANDDGTVTAVIEIMYQGPSESFSWLLPISSVPRDGQIGVASNVSFDRLQQATNPQYTLTTRVEGTCDAEPQSDAFGSGTPSASGPGNGGTNLGGDRGVTVEATGVVGAFEWTVISLDQSLPDAADAAVTWLGDNGYDVPPGAPGLLGPYLMDGMYLLALRLQKGADTGSIRPIVLNYEAEKPMIPIKLTAVAANADMGVLAWILGDGRAVPQNYNALELNEARINWFNASANYNQVVIAAANDAGGQGFVTEYAQPAGRLADLIWTPSDEINWSSFQQSSGAAPDEMYRLAASYFSSWDGFWDVVRTEVTLPAGVTLDALKDCPTCYEGFGLDAPAFLAALERDVIVPARVIEELLAQSPQVTRLYTTLSAPEMTVDPLFAFNPSLPPVDNLHAAERVIECGPGYYQSEAPWRIELPQGGVVRGTANDVGTWPAAFDAQPPNLRVIRQGESGSGRVIEDNTATIQAAVSAYSKTVPRPSRRSSGCAIAPGATAGGWTTLGLLLLVGLLGKRRQAFGGRR